MTNPSAKQDDAVAEEWLVEDKRDAVPFSNGTKENINLDDGDNHVDGDINETDRAHLSGQEVWNLIFCFLAWACNVSIVTLGTFITVHPLRTYVLLFQPYESNTFSLKYTKIY